MASSDWGSSQPNGHQKGARYHAFAGPIQGLCETVDTAKACAVSTNSPLPVAHNITRGLSVHVPERIRANRPPRGTGIEPSTRPHPIDRLLHQNPPYRMVVHVYNHL